MRPLGLVVVVALSLSLAACVPAPPERARDVVARGPLFETDAEALAAAEKVYREYSATSDDVGGGDSVDRIRAFLTPEWFEHEAEAYAALQSRGIRTVGRTEIAFIRLKNTDFRRITIYACQVTTNVRVQDTQGRDLTPRDRPPESLLEVTLVEDGAALRIAGSQLWSTSC